MGVPVGTDTISRLRYALGSGFFFNSQFSGLADIIDYSSGGGIFNGVTTAAGGRAALGLGTMSTQNANAVAVTGGVINGLSRLSAVGSGMGEVASFTGGYITIANGTFQSAPTFSTSEVLLKTSAAGQNVLALQNADPAGFPALTLRGDDNNEHGAFGFTNSANTYLGGNTVYLEISNFNGNPVATAPPNFTWAMTGSLDGTIDIHKMFQMSGATGTSRWFRPSTGDQAFMIDPINQVVDVNGVLQVGNGGATRTQVGTADFYGITTVGSQTANRTTDGTATLNVLASGAAIKVVNTGIAQGEVVVLGTPARIGFYDSTNSKEVFAAYTDNSQTSKAFGQFIAAGKIIGQGRMLINTAGTDTVNDGNDSIVVQQANLTQVRWYQPDSAVNGMVQLNKATLSDSFGGTTASMNIGTQSAHPLKFGTQGRLAMSFDTSNPPVGTFAGPVVASSIGNGASALTVSGSGQWTANGSTATALTALGPAGAGTTVKKWFTVTDNVGGVCYIPAF